MEIKRRFIETGFERRFQRVIREAQRRSSWHVIAAELGSSKSLGIGDLVRNSGAEKRRDGTTLLPLLAVRASEEDTKAVALGRRWRPSLGARPDALGGSQTLAHPRDGGNASGMPHHR